MTAIRNVTIKALGRPLAGKQRSPGQRQQRPIETVGEPRLEILVFFAGLAPLGNSHKPVLDKPIGDPPQVSAMVGTVEMGQHATGKVFHDDDLVAEIRQAVARGCLAPCQPAGDRPFARLSAESRRANMDLRKSAQVQFQNVFPQEAFFPG